MNSKGRSLRWSKKRKTDSLNLLNMKLRCRSNLQWKQSSRSAKKRKKLLTNKGRLTKRLLSESHYWNRMRVKGPD